MAYENVRSTGIVTVEENNEWRFGHHTDDGTVSVTLDLDTFNVDDETKRDKYLTGVGDKATTIWIKSGIPLAKIDESGAYGPYDPDATDGRQNKIAGLLESMVEVSVTFGGWEVVNGVNVGMRYRGDIIKSKLPVVPADDAVWGGSFFDIEDDIVTPLSAGTAGGTTTAPAIADNSVTSAKLVDGAATPAKLAGYDGNTGHGKIPQVKGDGTGFDFINPPAAYTLPAATAGALGGVKQVTLAADANPEAIVTALKASGIAK